MQHLEMFSFLYVQFQCGLVVSSKLHLALDVLPVGPLLVAVRAVSNLVVPAQVDERRRRGVDDLGFHITLLVSGHSDRMSGCPLGVELT